MTANDFITLHLALFYPIYRCVEVENLLSEINAYFRRK